MASRGVNKVIIVGNVGQDPETRSMPNGNAVTNLTVATSEQWKDKNTGEQQEKTEWHRVVFYQKLAEIVAQYVKKGSKIYLEGKLQTRMWEKDGQKHYSTEIIADSMQMLDGKPQDGQSSGPATSARGSASNASSAQQGPDAGRFDDDIPF